MASYTLFGIPNCNTVKKAQTWLNNHQVEFDFHNYKKDGLTAKQWNAWLQQAPVEQLVNKAGTTFRKLSELEKTTVLKPETSAEIVLKNPSIIKRPIIQKSDKIVTIGFKEDEYTQFFL